MAKGSEIEELASVVARQPGSPAYATLAEHYLEEGRVSEAVEVCRVGFAENPSFERGAVTYLAALRAKKDAQTAGEVFGRALAYAPRSARLRLTWALILSEAGRESEARRHGRDAAALEPDDEESKALLATLGYSAPAVDAGPFAGSDGSLTESPASSSPPPPPQVPAGAAAGSASASSGSDRGAASDGPIEIVSLSEQARVHRAMILPRVRPIGQRTTPHALFDLTPGPFRLDLDGKTPPPLDEPSPFDIPPPPPACGSVAPGDDSGPQVAGVEGGDSDEKGGARATPARSKSKPMDVVNPLPTPQSDDERASARRRKVRGLAAGFVLLCAGIASAFLGYRWHTQRALTREVTEALSLCEVDTRKGFELASNRLATVAKTRGAGPLTAAATALMRAQLSVRFAEVQTKGSAEPAGAPGAAAATAPVPGTLEEQLRAVASALDLLGTGRAGEALAQLAALERSPLPPWLAWHVTVARATAELARADVNAAVTTLDRALAAATRPFPALLHLRAQLARRARDLESAKALVEKGLAASPEHVGLQLESAFVALLSGEPVAGAGMSELAQSAANVARYRNEQTFLTALDAAARGQLDRARVLVTPLAEAHGDAPATADYAVQLALWNLAPGGNARVAAKAMATYVPLLSRLRPTAHVDLAEAMLRVGRPHAALQALDEASGIESSTKSAAIKELPRLQWLRARALHVADNERGLALQCNECRKQPATNVPCLVACAEAFDERSQLARADQCAKTVQAPDLSRYLEGLRALAVGDHHKALERLAAVENPSKLPDPVAHTLALARIHGMQGRAQRAVALLRDAAVRDALSARTQTMLAVALVSGGHDTEAQAILDEVLNDRPTAPALLALAGQAFMSLGLPEKASKLVTYAVEHDAASPAVGTLGARIALASNETNKAHALIKQVLDKTPSSPEALVVMGRIWLARKQPGRARRYFENAQKLRPQDPELLASLAMVHAQSHSYRRAVQVGNQAIEVLEKAGQRPRAMELSIELSRAFRDGDRFAQTRAEALLFAVTKQPSAPAIAFLELAKVYERRREQSRVIWCCREALKRDEQLAEAVLMLGQTLMKNRRNRHDARKALLRYLELRPKGKESTRIRRLVRRLR